MVSACLCCTAPVFAMLCLSLLCGACLCYAVPFRVGLFLSLLLCACPCYTPVFAALSLSMSGCACLFDVAYSRVLLCSPLRVPLLFRNWCWPWLPLIGVSFSFLYGYCAPLGGPSGPSPLDLRRSPGIISFVQEFLRLLKNVEQTHSNVEFNILSNSDIPIHARYTQWSYWWSGCRKSCGLGT